MDLAIKQPDFLSIAAHFKFSGKFASASLIDNGHIHNTYALNFLNPKGGKNTYILQEINTSVFRQPELVMQNIYKISTYLKEVISKTGGNPYRESITLIPTTDEAYYFVSEQGDFWRAMVFIDKTSTYQRMPSPHLYKNASQAFGRFQKLLAHFSPNELNVTIPDFHHTPKRFSAFLKAIEDDPLNRAISIKDDIQFILEREQDAGKLICLHEQGKLPLRVTHNDTKLDNVLIDDHTGEGICVIDLDTVMPGLFLYDFGDTVRSAANTAAEDEPDLSKVKFDQSVFELLVEGYLSEMLNLLTPSEIENLTFGAKLIIYEQAIRFLTDYLNGDIYYRIHRPNHNLDRSRTQIKLIQDFEAGREALEKIVEKHISG